MNSSEEIANQLSSIKKSNVSLADALREIELAKQSFEKISFLENTMNLHDLTLHEIKNQMQRFISTNFFNAKYDDLMLKIDQIIKSKFDEFSLKFFSTLNEKLSISDSEALFKQKVNYVDYNALSKKFEVIKNILEKHIYSDFEALKTKVKMNFSRIENQNNQQGNTNIPLEEIDKLNERIRLLEIQVQSQMGDEEMLDESYDSQEDLEIMLGNLEKAILSEHSASIGYEMSTNETHQMPFGLSRNSPDVSKAMLGEGLSPRYSGQRSRSSDKRLNGGLVQQIGKKFGIIQRELEINKFKIDEILKKSTNYETTIKDADSLMTKLIDKQLEIQAKSELIEKNVIKAINSPTAIQYDKDIEMISSNSKELYNQVKVDLEAKNNRLYTIETWIEKIVDDLNQVKALHREKINEIVKCMHDLRIDNNTTKVEVNRSLESVKSFEDSLEEKINKFNEELDEIKGPLIDLISNQERQNHILSVEINRQQEIGRRQEINRSYVASSMDFQRTYSSMTSQENSPIKEAAQLISETLKPSSARVQSASPKSATRVQSASPSLSAKSRCYQRKKFSQIGTGQIKLDENWLSLFPDGVQIQLPRVSVPSSKGSDPQAKETNSAEKQKIARKLEIKSKIRLNTSLL
ncbi:unnamed protein product [Blepharisma stoltei]|uniref:Uncharacterized protein n=1 Tax=Blepharisma stoltei TaxID=1481888 RepID=A0AAU9JKC8_9CILI|nr:unnamed protein product [Blepharisma stoltei]